MPIATALQLAAAEMTATLRSQPHVIETALAAFWQSIAESCPYIKTGDLDPAEAAQLTRAATRAVAAWIVANDPDLQGHKDAHEEILAGLASERMKCDQCQAAMIQGVFCHEHGCPNTRSRYEPSIGEWIKQRTCFTCGYKVDADAECCQPVDDDYA